MKNKLMALATVVMLFAVSLNIAAQTQDDGQKARPRTTTSGEDKDKKQKPLVVSDRLEPDDKSKTPADVPDEMQANRQEQLSEDAAIARYYNNFFSTYRLGPEDVISVDVFNQERYSRKDITIPPSGRVSLSLIPGGVFVNGKTVDEVAEIIRKRYDEYIINPQVTVSLEKASSYRYSVIGDVGQPGIRLMNHRMTVTEAIAEAGGVLSTGDKSNVVVLRRQESGVLAKIPVNLSAIYKGKAPDTTYLIPGDQIVVPGNKLKKVKEILGFTSILGFARIFGIPTF
ncbi:MAG TPA: polysaccharide biosynthesis/export family protein [Pyrinomonadaceae bacterium]|nr:polysaccharide biosynthesis/export family protein [Pyrinomonadaceae bacterium]